MFRRSALATGSSVTTQACSREASQPALRPEMSAAGRHDGVGRRQAGAGDQLQRAGDRLELLGRGAAHGRQAAVGNVVDRMIPGELAGHGRPPSAARAASQSRHRAAATSRLPSSRRLRRSEIERRRCPPHVVSQAPQYQTARVAQIVQLRGSGLPAACGLVGVRQGVGVGLVAIEQGGGDAA